MTPLKSTLTATSSKLFTRPLCDSEKTLSATCFLASSLRHVWQDAPTRSFNEIIILGNSRERQQLQEVSALDCYEAKQSSQVDHQDH
jgi:hypothetical protein